MQPNPQLPIENKKKVSNEAIDTIMVLFEILREIEEADDLLTKGFDMKVKIINRIAEEIDKV